MNQMRSSEHGTAYIRGGSVGDQSEGMQNKGVGLSHYKNAEKIVSGGAGLRGSNNEVRIPAGVGDRQQEDATSGGMINSDLSKINIQLHQQQTKN